MFAPWEGTDAQQSNFDAHPRTACVKRYWQHVVPKSANSSQSIISRIADIHHEMYRRQHDYANQIYSSNLLVRTHQCTLSRLWLSDKCLTWRSSVTAYGVPRPLRVNANGLG